MKEEYKESNRTQNGRENGPHASPNGAMSGLEGSQQNAMSMQYSYMYYAYMQQAMFAQQYAAAASAYGYPGYYAEGYARTSQSSTPQHSNGHSGANSASNGSVTGGSVPSTVNKSDPFKRQTKSAPIATRSQPWGAQLSKTGTASTSISNLTALTVNTDLQATPAMDLSKTSSSPSAGDNRSQETPMDLSRKAEKLQFLDTLKKILESREKAERNDTPAANRKRKSLEPPAVSNTIATSSEFPPPKRSHMDNAPLDFSKSKTDKIDNGVSKKSPDTTGSEKSIMHSGKTLQTTEDKRAYIAVLRELFEKGHSQTSQQILSSQKHPASPVQGTAVVDKSNNKQTSEPLRESESRTTNNDHTPLQQIPPVSTTPAQQDRTRTEATSKERATLIHETNQTHSSLMLKSLVNTNPCHANETFAASLCSNSSKELNNTGINVKSEANSGDVTSMGMTEHPLDSSAVEAEQPTAAILVIEPKPEVKAEICRSHDDSAYASLDSSQIEEEASELMGSKPVSEIKQEGVSEKKELLALSPCVLIQRQKGHGQKDKKGT